MKTKTILLLSMSVQLCTAILLNCAFTKGYGTKIFSKEHDTEINKDSADIRTSGEDDYCFITGQVRSYGGPLQDIPVTIALTYPVRETEASGWIKIADVNPKVITQTDSVGNFNAKIEKIFEQKSGRCSDYQIVINSPLCIAKNKGDSTKDVHFRSADTTITRCGIDIKIDSLDFYLEPEIGYIMNAFNENTGYKWGENLDQAKVFYLEWIANHKYSEKVNDFMITKEFLKSAEFSFHNHSFDLANRQFRKIEEWFSGEFKRINMEEQDAGQQAMTECRAIVEARNLISEENEIGYVNSLKNAIAYLDSCAIKFRTYHDNQAPTYILNETERLKDLLFEYVVINKVCDSNGNIRGNVSELKKYLQVCKDFEEDYGDDSYLAQKLITLRRRVELNLEDKMEQQSFNEILKKYNVKVDTPEKFLYVLKNPYAYRGDYILVSAVVERFVSPNTAIMRHAEDFFATFDVKIPKVMPSVVTMIAKVEGTIPGVTVLGVTREFLHLRVVYIRDRN